MYNISYRYAMICNVSKSRLFLFRGDSTNSRLKNLLKSGRADSPSAS